MLYKLIALHLFIITFNNAFELRSGIIDNRNKHVASVAKSGKVLNIDYTTLATDSSDVANDDDGDDKWQPIVQTHNSLVASTILTPVLSLSSLSSSWPNSNLSDNLTDNISKRKHSKYDNPQPYNSHAYNHIKSLTSTKSISASSPPLSKHISMLATPPPPVTLPTHHSNGNQGNNSSRELNDKYQFKSRHRHEHPFDTLHTQIPTAAQHLKSKLQQHQKLPLPLPLPRKANENNKKQSIAALKQNLHNLVDMAEYNELTYSSLTHSPHSQYLPSKQKLPSKREANNKADEKNSTDSITTITNENFSDNEIMSHVEKYDPQIRHDSSRRYMTNIFRKTMDKNITRNGAKSPDSSHHHVETAITPANDKEPFNVLLFLKKTVKNVQELYGYFKDIIMSESSNGSSDGDDYDDNDDEDYGESSSDEEDTTNDESNLQNSSSRQVVRDVSTALTAGIATALGNVGNMLFSLTSTAEGEGREKEVNESNKKFKLKLSATSPSPLRVTNKTQITTAKEKLKSPQSPTSSTSTSTPPPPPPPSASPLSNNMQTRGKLHNSFTRGTNGSVTTTTTQNRTPLWLSAPISKDVRTGNSGRKAKKIKKRFKKFLVSLLLAYKLKFFTLIPLLVTGLILLVGSTGLAGFFFALFVTAMTLGLRNPNGIRRDYTINRTN